MTVLQGAGNGTFTIVSSPVTGISTQPYSICAADFNNDGKQDLACANYGTSTITVFLGSGSCVFSSSTLYACGNHPTQIIATDINGDSYKDLATANYLGNNASVLIGSLTGFGGVTNFSAGSNPQSVCTGDLNLDGKQDLIVANGAGGANNVSVMLNTTPTSFTGTPTFTAKVNYSVGGNNPFYALSADFDGNGRADIATANFLSSNASIILNGPPVAGINGNLDICSTYGGTVLSANSASTFTWSTGSTAYSILVNPPVGTSTYSITEANGVCTATAVVTVTVTATPTLAITGNLNICSGTPTTLSATGASSYTWSSNAGGLNTSTVSVGPNSSATYTVAGSNGICISSASTTVNVTTTPTVVITASSPNTLAICSGQGTTLQSGGGAGSYTWSSGGSGSTENVSPIITTNYTLTEANGVCVGSGVVTVTVTPTPTVSISGTPTLCSGNSVVLSGAGASTYTWSSNAGSVSTSTVSVSPTTGTTYTLTGGTPVIGGSGECTNSATKSVTVLIPQAPNICMVTVDSLSKNNLIIWDKTLYPRVDTFYVYRDTANNNYCIVGRVPYSSLSEYADTARHIGAVNGDPNLTTYRYKLGYKDSCGNVSPMSPYHNTIYQYNSGSLFLWNAYQIEGQTSPVPGLSSYVLKRDNAGSTGNYVVAASAGAASTSINDPQYATYQTTADWRVETVWNITCQPSYKMGNGATQTAIVKSKSNISNNRTTSIKKTESNFSVYPNPTNGNLTITFANSTKGSVKVISVLGEEVFSEAFNTSTEKLNIDLSKYENGIYLVQVITNNTTSVKRIIKN